MSTTVAIGNAQGFWGDRGEAAEEMLARAPDLDFLTLDYLAEVSMSILAVQREQDAALGYARDFVDVVRSLAPYWSAGGKCRLIANAGGLNPRGCAEACRAALQQSGRREMTIAVVSGDDVLDTLRTECGERDDPFDNLDTGAPLTDVVDRLVTANAYLGAAPIVEALSRGAEIVITGRVADPSLTVAAAMHHFQWSALDWNRLAGATIAGHLIECGTQVTGGISTDWLDIPDPLHIGFPIVEVAEDGSCIVSKPSGTGGCINERTVKEQLLYEIGDPGNYLSPDVTVSFLGLRVDDLGNDRVRVSGASGSPPPETYKVSATYRDGFRAAGTLTIVGRDAVAKAHRCGEIVLQRVREAGHDLRESVIECLGSGECLPIRGEERMAELRETVLRIAVAADDRDAVERFARELIPLVTAGPQGTTGYADGRPRVHPVFRYWPCLIASEAVQPRVETFVVVGADALTSGLNRTGKGGSRRNGNEESWKQVSEGVARVRPSATSLDGTLGSLAHARSGDKGTSANIGVIARRPEDYDLLRDFLTIERVREYFEPFGVESVQRYELPNLHALNFVLRGILRNSLRTDVQGKALGQALLEMPLPESQSPSC